MNRGEDGSLYLVVHSGSRHLGKQVAEFYQDLGYRELTKSRACFALEEATGTGITPPLMVPGG